MKQLNIHGQSTMNFENQILHSKVTGSTNKELSIVWFEDMKRCVLSSTYGDREPWVTLTDARGWEMASPDIEEVTNTTIEWATNHNCLLFGILLSKNIQKFAMEKEFGEHSIVRFFFSADEAKQACLDILNGAKSK